MNEKYFRKKNLKIIFFFHDVILVFNHKFLEITIKLILKCINLIEKFRLQFFISSTFSYQIVIYF